MTPGERLEMPLGQLQHTDSNGPGFGPFFIHLGWGTDRKSPAASGPLDVHPTQLTHFFFFFINLPCFLYVDRGMGNKRPVYT